MIRIAFDTDVLAELPIGLAPILMTYADLITTEHEMATLLRKHPDSKIVLIDRGRGDPLGLASIADVEPGCLAPIDLPAWFKRKTEAKVDFLTVYSDRADLDAIDTALRGTGHESHWRFIATLDGTVDIAGLPALHRPAVVQIDGADKLGIHADMSLVLEPGWHPAA